MSHHDAYVRVLERRADTEIAHPRAFLYRSTLRQAEPLEVLDAGERPGEPALQHMMDQGQRLDLMRQALDELPTLCRDSFLLRKLDGLSHQEIAQHLNSSRALVEKHIVNAMKHCRARMREWENQ